MSYKIFLSYSEQEVRLAEYIRDSFGNAFEGQVSFYFAKNDILAGEKWKLNIQEALKSCDATLTILTPRYIVRPWAYIEWSAFWLANKTSYIALTDDVEFKDIVEPMKDSQSTRLFEEDEVRKLIKAISIAANIKRFPYEIVSEFVNFTKAIYVKIGEDEERQKFLVYKGSINLLPNDDFQKQDIFWYFLLKEANKDIAIQVFYKINDNAIKANILLQLLDRKEFEVIEKTYQAVENKHNLLYVVKSLIEFGHEDDILTEKIVEYLSENQPALRSLGEFLVKKDKLDLKLFEFIIFQFKNRAELRKLGENIIDETLVTHRMFDILVNQFYGHNHAELRKLLIYLINSNKYNKIEIEEQIIKLANHSQNETEKVLNELLLKDKELVTKLVVEEQIIDLPEILARLKDKL